MRTGDDKEGSQMAKFEESSDLVKCSFCGKPQKAMAKLIAGPGIYICNECVVLCASIVQEEMADAAKRTAPLPSPLSSELKNMPHIVHSVFGAAWVRNARGLHLRFGPCWYLLESSSRG